MRIEQFSQNRRKIERRIDDWKPMPGMDRRTYGDGNYYGFEKRIRNRRINDRRECIYTLPERRNLNRRKSTERRGRLYFGSERRQADRRIVYDRRKSGTNIKN